MRQALSQGSPQLLHRGFRSAGGHVRLRRGGAHADPRGDRGAAPVDVAVPRAAARGRRADRRPAGRLHAPDPGRPAGPGARRRRALHQERRRQLSDALVQGPRRRRGAVEGRRARLPDRRLRLDGQPRQQRRGQRRRRRARGLRPHPRRPRAGQGPGRDDLRRQGHRHRGQLRPGQPPLLADRLPVRLGIRQRQPPAVLRRGLEDRSASRSPRTWAGARPTMSSRRWPAAA